MLNENTEGKIKELIELSLLYDFYGELLKDHSKSIFEDYVLNDYSLGEIAEKVNISRQGVYDIVKRCSSQLKDYEKRLHLLEKHNSQQQFLNKLICDLNKIYEKEDDESIKDMLSELAEEANTLLK